MGDENSINEKRDSPLFGTQFFFLWLLILMILAGLLKSTEVTDVPYSEFLKALKNDRVEDVSVKSKEITGKLKVDTKTGKTVETRFKSIIVDPEIAKVLARDANLRFSGESEQTFWTIAIHLLLPIMLIVFIISGLTSRKGGVSSGLLSIGHSNARVYVEEQIKTTFDDVAGADEAKEELEEVITFLKEPQRYQKLGGKLPKGILLVGPPGTGKTLIARAVAGEAGVPFFSISGSEFVEMFVGVGAARVRDLFLQAKSKAPCIIFIDEIDALGKARGVGPLTGGHDEKEQTLNQLLSELDGFDSIDGVILLAATNRPEILDPALLRAGRFDRQVLVDRPDKKGRIDILKVHLRKVVASNCLNIDEIAAMTPGFTGADLANLVNEAALLAARRNAKEVSSKDVLAAFERIVAGLEKKNRLLNEQERKVVAYHEMGHALVALSLPGSEPVQKVSIIPRGIGALGYTLSRPTEDRFLMSRHELENKMTVLMGGRAAECLVFHETSTGAADDFAKATEIARNMVARYGMVDQVGMVTYLEEQSLFLSNGRMGSAGYSPSEKTKKDLDLAVKKLLQDAFDMATRILCEKRETLDRGARRLLEQETLSEEDLKELINSCDTPTSSDLVA